MMKRIGPWLVCVAAVLAAGCASQDTSPSGPQVGRMESWMVDAYHRDAVHNGIIAGRTIYPHEFMQDSDQLNELGRYTVKVLAEHFAAAPGELIVRPGRVTSLLHEQRVAAVSRALTDAGVDPARVRITNNIPGGDGMPAERVVLLVDLINQPEALYQSSSESLLISTQSTVNNGD